MTGRRSQPANLLSTAMDAPIAAAQTASGYEVAWKTPGADQYQIWTTDSSGNELSILRGVGRPGGIVRGQFQR